MVIWWFQEGCKRWRESYGKAMDLDKILSDFIVSGIDKFSRSVICCSQSDVCWKESGRDVGFSRIDVMVGWTII